MDETTRYTDPPKWDWLQAIIILAISGLAIWGIIRMAMS